MYIISASETADGIDANSLSKEEERRIHGTGVRFRGRENCVRSLPPEQISVRCRVNMAGKESGRVIVAGIDDSPVGNAGCCNSAIVVRRKQLSPECSGQLTRPRAFSADEVQNDFFCLGNPAHCGVLPEFPHRSLGRRTPFNSTDFSADSTADNTAFETLAEPVRSNWRRGSTLSSRWSSSDLLKRSASSGGSVEESLIDMPGLTLYLSYGISGSTSLRTVASGELGTGAANEASRLVETCLDRVSLFSTLASRSLAFASGLTIGAGTATGFTRCRSGL